MAKVKSVDYIITARHYAASKGVQGGGKAWTLRCVAEIGKSRGVRLVAKNIDNPSGKPVAARIEQGAWIADCECGGAMFVDPDEPIFFCCACGNRANAGKVRPVRFPDPATRTEIEQLLLARPVDDMAGLNDLERAGLARPLVYDAQRGGLARNWLPTEGVSELQEQNKLVDAWQAAKRRKKAGK